MWKEIANRRKIRPSGRCAGTSTPSSAVAWHITWYFGKKPAAQEGLRQHSWEHHPAARMVFFFDLRPETVTGVRTINSPAANIAAG